MLGSGKSSGVINEATNLKANENLTAAIEQMATREYQKTRDENDIIPTHRRQQEKKPKDSFGGLPVYDPTAEKKLEQLEKNDFDIEKLAENASDDEDLEFFELRRMRMQKMKEQHNKEAEWRSKQHGEYREISQDEFFNTVVREKGGSELCCIHFFHKDFESCKVMDRRLSELSKQVLAVKFAKVDAERSPFLVERLKIMTLPCLLLFKNDVCIDRIFGFEGCTDEDGCLDPQLLRERLEATLELSTE